jgi:DNA-directed RNA polymerase subunit RPC12/RpoP
MNCGRCGAGMLKSELYLSKTPESIKKVAAWRCNHCGRIEYYASQLSGEASFRPQLLFDMP